ncbi:hypothetical protein [Nonomuraea rhodomycinica]|uniref:Uncharacterized protein n=1 Tax=Nonomuraea rhodomycinica TaxID=1712872 RepID=A0A7Y6IPQ1_9ACTN|nr:hypothetical protein [Nonomuraea rhodomycinica]NUW42142.1 hypothetical protein [Nonomuraea rhodomycinica]
MADQGELGAVAFGEPAIADGTAWPMASRRRGGTAEHRDRNVAAAMLTYFGARALIMNRTCRPAPSRPTSSQVSPRLDAPGRDRKLKPALPYSISSKLARVVTSVAVCLIMGGCSGKEDVRTSPPAVAPSATTIRSTAATVARSERWKVIQGPRLMATAELVDVVAKGPRQVWAAGSEGGAEDRGGIVVVERWDGARWRRSALNRDREILLSGFDVGATGDLWIVGDHEVIHGDGQRWSYPRPSKLPDSSVFTDVSVDGDRVVLIGGDEAGEGSFAYEWAGHRFEKRLAAVQGDFAAVTARHGQVWVVGNELRDDCSNIRPAVWHAVRGGKYTRMLLPDVVGGYLNQVWATSPADVWAVGGVGGKQGEFECLPESQESGQPEPLVMHGDGSSWQRVGVPGGGSLTSVTASGPDEVWAVGSDRGDAMIALHFDGRNWTREYAYASRLSHLAVTTVPGTSDLWAVGAYGADTDYGQDVILRRR